MGRRRIHLDRQRPLPPGLYKKGRQYRARRTGEKWVWFGDDYVTAIAQFATWKQTGRGMQTVAELLDHFASVVCPARVKAKELAARTARDYVRDIDVLKKGLGKIPLIALEPHHIVKFREARAPDAPTHVRNEMACLSAALTWAVDTGRLNSNPALQVRRPSKKVRQRLITDAEYLAVYAKAIAPVRLSMVLAVRTLALPADILRMGQRNVRRLDDGRRTLAFRRGKTNVGVEVEIVGELATALAPVIDSLHPTFVRTRRGKPYSVSGIGAMFRRYCIKAGVEDFGLRDLRAKGATEMFRADPNSIRKIQLLLGHRSVQTTEIYLKQLITEVVRPNERPILSEMK